jgi:hypothetical protein
MTTPYTTAAVATPEWRIARDAYIGHRMTCPVCRSPAGHHCPAGLQLRQQYNQTPMRSMAAQ